MSSRHPEIYEQIYSIKNIEPMIIAQIQKLCKNVFTLMSSANSEENLVKSRFPLERLEELVGKGNVSVHRELEEDEILYIGGAVN